MDREKRIKDLAGKYRSREQAPHKEDQEAWDKAVQKTEREGSEASRGPVKPDPQVGGESAPTR